MDSLKPTLPLKSDIVFKMFFADEPNKKYLVKLLKSILQLDETEYDSIEIIDPHLLPEYIGDKSSIIDVKLHTKSGNVVHIEIQLRVTDDFKKRVIYYTSKLITEQLGASQKYGTINNVISIVITDETLVESNGIYHHRFTLFDKKANVEFSDTMEIHTIEMNKLPKENDGTELYDWVRLIKADTEEALDMLAEQNPQFKEPIVILRKLSADEQKRHDYEYRERARRDLMMYENDAEKRGIDKVLNLILSGQYTAEALSAMSVTEINALT